MKLIEKALYIIVVMLAASCSGSGLQETACSADAVFLKLGTADDGTAYALSISPADGSADSLSVSGQMSCFVCMSGSYAACLEELAEAGTVAGVSGVDFVSSEIIRANAAEVGYEGALDYEKVISLQPDLVLACSNNGSKPEYAQKLENLGVRVFVIYDNLEQHPLARASYIRLFGLLTGKATQADSIYSSVRSRYEELCAAVQPAMNEGETEQTVMMNLPYQDQWYVPGGNSYMSRLICDAGGRILGAEEGKSASSVISVERAFELSAEADFWLHPGMCSSKRQIKEQNPLFGDFPSITKPIYNNTARVNPRGGNDFWESGALHPELILEDLVRIFHPDLLPEGVLHYYIEVKD